MNSFVFQVFDYLPILHLHPSDYCYSTAVQLGLCPHNTCDACIQHSHYSKQSHNKHAFKFQQRFTKPIWHQFAFHAFTSFIHFTSSQWLLGTLCNWDSGPLETCACCMHAEISQHRQFIKQKYNNHTFKFQQRVPMCIWNSFAFHVCYITYTSLTCQWLLAHATGTSST